MQRSLDDNQMTAINAYLDGLLSADEVTAFEVQLAEDENLAQHVAWQRAIQQRLQSSMDFEQLRAQIEQKIDRPAPILRLRTLVIAGLAAAAAIVLSFTISEISDSWTVSNSGGGYHLAPKTPAEVYDQLVELGFKPTEVCTAAQVPGWTERKLGVRLALAEVPDDVTLLGWSYGYDMPGLLMGSYAGVLLTSVEGTEVLVVMDQRANDRDLSETGREGLFIYRRELGGMVFYEISPLSEPHVNPLFKVEPPTDTGADQSIEEGQSSSSSPASPSGNLPACNSSRRLSS